MGWREGLPGVLMMVITGAMIAYALGGVLYIAIRYGQGGARLEKARIDTPLTNGLADNRQWVLGVFYVNRDDPSILVERRFGFGYTINFGNWKALLLMAVFFGTLFGIAALALLTD